MENVEPVHLDNNELKSLLIEYKHKNELLRENENRFRTVTNMLPVGIFYTDPEGNFLFVNEQWCCITGLTVKESLGNGWMTAFHQDDGMRVLKEWDDAVKNKRTFKSEFRLTRPDGKITWVLCMGIHAVFSDSKKTKESTGYVATITDITERKFMEEELRKSKDTLAHAQRIAQLSSWEWDIENKKLYMPEGIFHMYGFSQEQSPRNIEEFIACVHEDDRNLVKDAFYKVLHEGKSLDIEYRIILPDETERVIRSYAEIAYNDKNEPLKIIIANLDITENVYIEEELHKLHRAVEYGPAAVMITNTRGQIEYINQRFTQLTDYKYDEVIGKNPSILKSGSTPPELYKHLWKTVTSGEEWRGELCNKKKNGELYWESMSISPVKNRKDEIVQFIAIMEDVTDRKRLEMERDSNFKNLRRLMDFSTFLDEEIQEDVLLKHLSKTLKDILNPDVIAILLLDNDNHLLNVAIIDPPELSDKIIRDEVLLEPSLCRVIRTGKELYVSDIAKEHACECLAYKFEKGGFACFPLITGGTTIGMLFVIKEETGYWNNEGVKKLLATYVGLAMSALQRIRLMNFAKRTAITDALTGVYNRRFFDEMLKKQLALTKRRDESLCLLLLDFDHFKSINDTYGHTAGDRVLQEVSKMLNNSLRASDVLARYGGEEFVIIMPGADISHAKEKAEIIRESIEAMCFDTIVHGQTLKLTISIGIASFPECRTGESLVNVADDALYKAKKNGRNRVEIL
ncbi:MAG: diguanylate cyclase [Candidatus Kuenenia sp.]|nr:diguanylate cyclase [Candidatus Kuenenia hertensis]